MEICEKNLASLGISEKEIQKVRHCARSTNSWLRKLHMLEQENTGGRTMRDITILDDKEFDMDESELSEIVSDESSVQEEDYDDDFEFEY